MDSAQIPNAAPQAVRTGQPRSFWMILGLSIVTCGIYYVVYCFMVASELKRATTWNEDESYKPSTFMLLFGAYVALLYIFPTLYMFAFGTKLFMAIAANPGNPEATAMNMAGSYQMLYLSFMLMVHLLGYYVVYYFLKLNNIAASKVGAKPLGIRSAFIAYSIFLAFLVMDSMMDILVVATDFNTTMTESMRNIENLSLSSLGPIMLLGMMGLGLTLLIIISIVYFLWKQTELVNHVWEAGHFTTPLNGYGYHTPHAQPAAQYPVPNPPQAPPVPSSPIPSSPTPRPVESPTQSPTSFPSAPNPPVTHPEQEQTDRPMPPPTPPTPPMPPPSTTPPTPPTPKPPPSPPRDDESA